MNRSEILHFVQEQLLEEKQHRLLFLIEYGSCLEGHDVDMVAIFEGTPPRREFSLGKVDLICYDASQALELARHLDPLLTDPLLNGRLVWGEKERHQAFLVSSGSHCELSQSNSHLLERSFQEYLSAQGFLRQASARGAEACLWWALINLSFSTAFWSFAAYYLHHQTTQPISTKELEKEAEGQLLHEILQSVRLTKNNPSAALTPQAVQTLFSKFESLLAGKTYLDFPESMSETMNGRIQ
jgi:hypothetical protein